MRESPLRFVFHGQTHSVLVDDSLVSGGARPTRRRGRRAEAVTRQIPTDHRVTRAGCGIQDNVVADEPGAGAAATLTARSQRPEASAVWIIAKRMENLV